MANGVNEKNIAAEPNTAAGRKIDSPDMTAPDSAAPTPSSKDLKRLSALETPDADFAALVSEQLQNAARRSKEEPPAAVASSPGIYPPPPPPETQKWPIAMSAGGMILILVLVMAYVFWPLPEYDYSVPEARLRDAQKAFREAETPDSLQRLAGSADAILATNFPETERGRALRDEAMKLRQQVDQAQKDLALWSVAVNASRTAVTESDRSAVIALLEQFVAVSSDAPLILKNQNDARNLIVELSGSGEVETPQAVDAEELYRQASDLLERATTTEELDQLIAQCRSLLKQTTLDPNLRSETEGLLRRAIASREALEKYLER